MKFRETRIMNYPSLTFVLIFFSATILLCSGGTLQATTTSVDVQADISVKSRPLKEVVNIVQEQTGYRVELKSIDESFLVTGKYSKVAVEKIFTHLLKGYNISVAINPTNKLISVISLGGKIELAKNTKNIELVPPAAAEVTAPESLPPVLPDTDIDTASDQSLELTGLSNQDLQKLHTQQARDFDQHQNDPKAIDPFTGMTMAALEDMQKKQLMEPNQTIK